MNGVAKRGFRTDREKAAAMIQDANLSTRIKKTIGRKAEEILASSSLPESL